MKPKPKSKTSTKTNTKAPPKKKASAKPKLLSGGNPQIAMGDGAAPVKAYIAALDGWRKDVVRDVDALVVRTVPGVQKAVKWNSPFYGAGQGWFLSIHLFTRYVKLTFFRGTSLRPPPPGESKTAHTRYYDVYEGELDEVQLAKWIRQASRLPGWQTSPPR